jgi:hypothetical protein
MNARNLHPSARKNNATTQRAPDSVSHPAAQDVGLAEHTCCCPAKAVVRVTMPPAPGRPHETDLLLCGHHYRVSRHALASDRAAVRELPGTSADVAAWIRPDRGALLPEG